MEKIIRYMWGKYSSRLAYFQFFYQSKPYQKVKGLAFFVLLFLSVANTAHAQKWEVVANEEDIASGASAYTTIALVTNGTKTTPYVAYTESGMAKVKMQQDNGTWASVGKTVSSGNATHVRLFADKAGNLYISYVDAANGNRLAVKNYNMGAAAWEPLGNIESNLYVSSGSVTFGITQFNSTRRSALAFDSNNTPYVVFGEGSGLNPTVKKFNGTIWETVGAGPVSSDRAISVDLTLDENNVPYVVYMNQASASSTTGNMAFHRFANNAWEAIAVPSPVPGGSANSGATTAIRHTSIASAGSGNLVLAYFNTGNFNRATVVFYNSITNVWSFSAALSGRDATDINLTKDASGNLFASFTDAVSSAYRGAGRVFKQAVGSTTWTELRDEAVATGIDEPVGSFSFAIGSGMSNPYVVYTKSNSGGVVTPIVRMFAPTAVLTTRAVANITGTSVETGGNITFDGGTPITERGVVYGMSVNPTTANGKVADALGGTGSFTATITGLVPASVYYVRAYAVNRAGTAYGENVTFSTPAQPDEVVTAPKQVEYLNRGLVAVRVSASKVYLGWRLLGTDPADIAFNLYRNETKLNSAPLSTYTNFEDNTAINGTYTVRPVVNGVEGEASESVAPWSRSYLSIPLQIPEGGTTPAGTAYTYEANDCSVGDVDGDGAYEIFVKWDPTALNHNSGGYSGHQIIDCYKMDGTRLWRIDLGRNINAGPHFTQFMVYDFDGDGKAEIMLKTADGTMDGTGAVIGDAQVDHRDSNGWVHRGPEFLTVFNGETGAAMATVNFEPARGSISDWGDSYGNRADRFLAAVAYLDGSRPSLVMGRGYYEKLVRAAYDWRDGRLTLRWVFDSTQPGNGSYAGMGNHQMTVGDGDGDGKDEIYNGSSAINDNGRRLWSNGFGHGDALHMTDMDPDRPGQEMWMALESPSQYAGQGLRMIDPKTGAPIWGVATTGDVGRAMAADIDPAHKGYEVWGSSGNLYNARGEQIGTNTPSFNFGIWWDGDLSRELLDKNVMDKWNPATNSMNRLFTIYNAAPVSSNNDSKATPSLTADLMGDWREEMIFRRSDNTALILFTTTTPTLHRIPTLMHDSQYRVAVAWQNSGYNQPPYPSFYLGHDMATPPQPNIFAVKSGTLTSIEPEKNIVSQGINVYPNPSSSAFTATAKGALAVTVFDGLGRLLLQKQGQQAVTFGQELRPGIYLVRVETASGRTVTRVIKQ